jgi:glycosyltransferase involved in cell wall biosynthesis
MISYPLTIITPTYNSGNTISDCLQSVHNSIFYNFEHLIIDGKSSDNTLLILNQFKKDNPKANITIVSEKDNGIYHALNKGINLANGEIIGFVHSDDLIANTGLLSEIYDKFNKFEIDGLYGDLNYVSQTDTNKIIRVWKSQAFKKKYLKFGWMPPHPTLFLKKKVYLKIGLFNTSYKISGDYDFILRVFSDSSLKFHYLPKVITKMRVGGISNSNIKNILKKTKEDYLAVNSNDVGGWITIFIKNFSKLKQFLKK